MAWTKKSDSAIVVSRGTAYVQHLMGSADLYADEKINSIFKSQFSDEDKITAIKARIIEMSSEAPETEIQIKQIDWDEPEINEAAIQSMIEDYREEV